MKYADGLSENTQRNYKASLRQFLRFVNSKKGLNKEVEGYLQREKKMKESSANQRAYGYLRGFFANLDVAFDRKWTRRIPQVERPKQQSKKTAFTRSMMLTKKPRQSALLIR